MKILIAEDDPTSRIILVAIVTEWGYEPFSVEDGVQALSVLKTDDAPRLLLLDWEMPEINGLTLCKKIREKDTSDPPYIILLTGRSDTEDIVTGLKIGANDYISKPFENAELKARLQVGERMLELQDELNRAKEAMAIQANYDELTELMNRRAVMNAMSNEIARSKRNLQPLYICMCDIDHFKNINDTHGHIVGDAVLKEVAQRLNNSLRPYDLCGRYGGEEFLIILNSKGNHVQDLFERIRRAIANTPFFYEDTILNVTISAGVTLYAPSTDERNSTQLLTDADIALYEAKNAGRNRIVFNDD
ncbi:MAG: two-component system cell cycle response regulator [Oleiphilaceae bacterium]|jgi:two-component system cell cycle response regulator